MGAAPATLSNDFCSHVKPLKVIAGLLLLAAIAELAVTLGQDYGPSSDSTTPKNPIVFITNPVLFAVSWVCSLTDHHCCQFRHIEENVEERFVFA